MASLGLYRRVLGARFDELPDVLKRFHDGTAGARPTGRFGSCVGRGRSGISWRTLLRLPRAGESVPIRLEVVVEGDRERWVRHFPGRRTKTVQWADGNLLMERFGLTSFSSALVVQGSRLRYEFRRAWFAGIPLPLWISPYVDGYVDAGETGWRVVGAHLRAVSRRDRPLRRVGRARMSDSARVVTVLGGYGIFGGRIAEALARDEICRVRVVGRSAKIGHNFAHRVGADFYPCLLDDRDALAPRDRRVVSGHSRRRALSGSRLPCGRAVYRGGCPLPRPGGRA